MGKVIIGALVVIAAVGAIFFASQNTSTNKTQESSRVQMTGQDFSTPKKSAHYESNTPEHGATLAGVPINVVIDFNFDLSDNSIITLAYHKDSSSEASKLQYAQGDTTIDRSNKLSMRRKIKPDAPDGFYTVYYNACWPDKSCHDGNFQFALDRSLGSSYDDLTGQREVTVNMSNIKFMPMNIKISKGAKVTWVNDDPVNHYVNTDSHPAHTYYPDQNSKALKKGDSYSLSFDQEGVYPYHCSTHADSMTGTILVE